MTQTIFVTGATGTQGGGVVKELLRHSTTVQIHALVRDPTSPSSQALSALSPRVKLFKGNFDDLTSIQAAAESCTGAFLNVTPVFDDWTRETTHGKNLISTCASIPSLKRIIWASSGGMHQPPDSKLWSEYIPNNPSHFKTFYMKSKMACEDAVTGTTPDEFEEGWAIVRGMTFLTNFITPVSTFHYPDLATTQTITTAMRPGLELAYLDPNDISVHSAEGLLANVGEWNARFKGRFVPLGKQNLSLEALVEVMNGVLEEAGSEKKIRLLYVPDEEARERAKNGDIFVDSQLFQNEFPSVVGREEVKAAGVDVEGMVGVREFFERERERLVAAVGGL